MNFAILIDAENVPASRVSEIIEKSSALGRVTLRRAYTDWTTQSCSEWKKQLLEYAITPVQQFRYTTGKNGTDCAMIVDAMDILYSNKIDGFVIVSGDSDFTRLVTRLRESGKTVVGIGQKHAAKPLIAACDIFLYLNDPKEEAPKKDSTGRGDTISDTISMIARFIAASPHIGKDGYAPLYDIGSQIKGAAILSGKKKPYNGKLSDFISRIDRFDMVTRTGNGQETNFFVRDKLGNTEA